MYVAIALSIVALFVAGFALLISVGTAIRVQRIRGVISSANPDAGLAQGSPLPAEVLGSLQVADDHSEWSRGFSLVSIISPNCKPCGELVENLNRKAKALPAIPMAVIETRIGNAQSLKGQALFSAAWLSDPEGSLQSRFATTGTPHTFLFRDGRVADQIIGADITRLLEGAARHQSVVSTAGSIPIKS